MIRSPIVLLIAATTLIRLAFAATTGLGVDESYMVTAGRVLSLGYFDHPPAAWWLSWGASHLLGTEAPIVVRLPFILLFAVSQLLMWRIGCLVAESRAGTVVAESRAGAVVAGSRAGAAVAGGRAGGFVADRGGDAVVETRRAGFWAVVALNLSPVFGVTTGTWVLPDGPLDAALLGAVLCLLRALSGGDRSMRWWAGAGVCAGLALFSKYTAVLSVGGAFLYLLTSRRDRVWLARPGPYVAAILALAVFAPVLVWNATHGWASFAFQGDRAAGMRFRPLMPLITWGGEALFVLPWIWLPMMLLFVRGFRPEAAWPHRLLAWIAAPPILAFAVIAAWSSQRILFHWAAPGYLMLFPLLGQAVASRLDRPWVRRTVTATAVLVLAAVTIISTQIQFDWLGGKLGMVMRRDPTAEGLDWTSLRAELASRGLLPPGSLVAGLNWRDTGKIGYGLGPAVTALCLSTDQRQFGFAFPPRDFAGRSVLVLSTEPPAPTIEEAKHWFGHLRVLPDATVRLDRRLLQRITVIEGQDLVPLP